MHDVKLTVHCVSDWSTKLWLTLISPDLKEACVDVPIDAPSVSMTFGGFRDDTLFVLTQDVVQNQGRTVVRLFHVDKAECIWVPTRLVRVATPDGA